MGARCRKGGRRRRGGGARCSGDPDTEVTAGVVAAARGWAAAPAREADPVGGLAVGGGGAADREVTAGVVAAARGWAAAPAGEADPRSEERRVG